MISHNGKTYAMALSGDGSNLYVGGAFDQAGIPMMGGSIKTSTQGLRSGVARPGGHKINRVIGDGSGGVYIGGLFSTLGGLPVTNLGHVNADGTVDTDFTPNPDGEVRDLVIIGSNLFLCGLFNTVDSATRKGLAAVSTSTGAVDTGFTGGLSGSATSSNYIQCIVNVVPTGQGNHVLAGGNFTNTSDGTTTVTNTHLMLFDATTGAPTWSGSSFYPNSTVSALAVTGSTTVYIASFATTFTDGGSTYSNASSYYGICRASMTSKTNPVFASSGQAIVDSALSGSKVKRMKVMNSALYVAFTGANITSDIKGMARATSDGTVLDTSFKTPIDTTDDIVYDFYLDGEEIVMVGKISAGSRVGIMSVDKDTGADSNQVTATLGGSDSVFSAAPFGSSDEDIYVGGDHETFLNPVTVGNFITVSVTDGSLVTSVLPVFSSIVNTITVSGGYIYVGGNFVAAKGTDDVSATSRQGAAAFAEANGAIQNWNPINSTSYPGITSIIISGDYAFLGGDFSSIRNGAGTASVSDVAVTESDPTLAQLAPNTGATFGQVSGDVYSLLLEGRYLYIGTNSGNNIFLYRFPAGPDYSSTPTHITNFNPNPNGTVHSMVYDPVNEWLYLGGTFTELTTDSVSGLKYVARVRPGGHQDERDTDLTWKPQLPNSSYVYDMELTGAGLVTAMEKGVVTVSKTDDAAIMENFPFPTKDGGDAVRAIVISDTEDGFAMGTATDYGISGVASQAFTHWTPALVTGITGSGGSTTLTVATASDATGISLTFGANSGTSAYVGSTSNVAVSTQTVQAAGGQGGGDPHFFPLFQQPSRRTDLPDEAIAFTLLRARFSPFARQTLVTASLWQPTFTYDPETTEPAGRRLIESKPAFLSYLALQTPGRAPLVIDVETLKRVATPASLQPGFYNGAFEMGAYLRALTHGRPAGKTPTPVKNVVPVGLRYRPGILSTDIKTERRTMVLPLSDPEQGFPTATGAAWELMVILLPKYILVRSGLAVLHMGRPPTKADKTALFKFNPDSDGALMVPPGPGCFRRGTLL